jgi:sn-glycerol 3-phosphate transport system ATP-binding protein
LAEVRLQGVRVSYGSAEVLKGIELTIPDGGFTVVIGPSGSGKSTLLKVIAGLEMPTAGDVYFGSQRVTDVPVEGRGVGMVFQSYALFSNMTVYENLAFGLRTRGVPRDEERRRVGHMATLLGLAEKLGRRPAELSGGERQRVALGRALIRHPAVLLMDEPLSNLDAQLRHRVRREIADRVRAAQSTVVYVTHDQVEAMSLADQIVVMHEGRIQQVGTPREIYGRPATQFVATFFGDPPMNLLPVAPAGDRTVALAGARFALPALEGEDTVLVGFRPEDVVLGAPGPRDLSVTADVEGIEDLGSHVLAYLRIPEGPFTVRAGKNWRPADRRIQVSVDPARLHFFAASGERLDAVASVAGA